MTSHEYANFLLSKPNLPIYCLSVREYAEEDASIGLRVPTAIPAMSEDPEGKETECLIISATAKQ
jgi:hypothetical protein